MHMYNCLCGKTYNIIVPAILRTLYNPLYKSLNIKIRMAISSMSKIGYRVTNCLYYVRHFNNRAFSAYFVKDTIIFTISFQLLINVFSIVN